eukprot:6187609-Pleurochrysis_carterae.AAC.2
MSHPTSWAPVHAGGLPFTNKASGKTLLGGYMPLLNNTNLREASDSDWAANRSTPVRVYTLAGAPTAWGSKKQHCAALSSCEADIMVTSMAT